MTSPQFQPPGAAFGVTTLQLLAGLAAPVVKNQHILRYTMDQLRPTPVPKPRPCCRGVARGRPGSPKGPKWPEPICYHAPGKPPKSAETVGGKFPSRGWIFLEILKPVIK